VTAGNGSDPGVRRCTAVVTMRNPHGLHARPAHLWVQTANSFASRLRVGRAGEEMVDGKSIMGIMMLAAECGTDLTLEAEGPDCEEQVRAIRELVDSGFGED
jgi:phosphotransferase system HPr (HPr) family protein